MGHGIEIFLMNNFFRGADCNTDHCLMVAIVRERLAVSKQTT
jgi:hypothetical protein